jgi:hypothetical protein
MIRPIEWGAVSDTRLYCALRPMGQQPARGIVFLASSATLRGVHAPFLSGVRMLPTVLASGRRSGLLALAVATLLCTTTVVPTAYGQGAPPSGDQPRGGQAGGQDGGRGGDGLGRRGGGGMGRMFGGGGPGGGMGGGMRDIREQFDPDFVRRDVPIFREQLKLDESQTIVLETLMGDYEAEYQTASGEAQGKLMELGQSMMGNFISPEMRDRFQQQMQQVQEELRKLAEEKGGELDEETRRNFFRERMQQMQQEVMDERRASGADAEMRKIFSDMFESMSTWMTKKEAMRATFVDSMKASLNDEQLAQWDAFDRFLRREKTLPKARLDGEGLNLFLLVDEMQMPKEEFEKIVGILDEYELRLDAALRARNEYLGSSMSRLFKSLESGDSKEGTRIMERQVELRAAVRDVNDEYRTAIKNALGESEWGEKFAKSALREGYERIFRQTATERAFEAALGFSDLDDAVRTSITELQKAYLSELGLKNNEILGILRKEEPDRLAAESSRFVTMMAGAMSGDMSGFGPFGDRERGPDKTREAFDERSKVGDSYLERLRAMLTPAQVEQLPSRERRGGGGGGGGGIARMLESLPPQQREDLMKRFDKNKDGEIDESERGDMFRALRDEGGFGVGPGGGGRGGEGGGRGGDRPRRDGGGG